MRTVFITEGDGEHASLPILATQLYERTGAVLIPPMKVSVQPDGPPQKIAHTIQRKLLPVIKAKRVGRAIVLLDRETRGTCSGAIADEVLTAIRDACGSGIEFVVVIKDRCFENWLVSDIEALRAQPRRFRVTAAVERRVAPNRADSIDAQELISSIVIGGSYNKVEDAKRTLKFASVDRMAQNSRSVRHLLHVLGDPTYSAGCRAPAT